MRIALGAGHTLTGKGTGASGYINESKENRVMYDLVKKWLEKDGHTVFSCNVDQSDTYLQQQVALANRQSVDLAVQIHFNANVTTSNPMGTETLYYGGAEGTDAANRVTKKLGTKFKQRGAKQRQELYWLRNTKAPAILIETCFCDSKADTDIYNADKDGVAKLIAEGIVGHDIAADSYGNGDSKVFPLGNYHKDVVICADVLNVRTAKDSNAPLVELDPKSQFVKGQIVNIWYIGLSPDGAHWGSCSYNGKTGHIHMGYVKPV